MTCNIDFHIQLATIMLNLVGKTGPITIDTCAVDHNYALQNEISDEKIKELTEQGIFTVGKNNSVVTKDDLVEVLEQIGEYLSDEVFENGRSYWFEGFYPSNNALCFRWGS